jgi:hypothetical protein
MLTPIEILQQLRVGKQQKYQLSLFSVDKCLVAMFYLADEHLFEVFAVLIQFPISLAVLIEVVDVSA